MEYLLVIKSNCIVIGDINYKLFYKIIREFFSGVIIFLMLENFF